MYIPNQFNITDQAEVVAFMQRFSFGLIITAKDGHPMGTHLPFLVKEVQGKITLISHFARQNPQWKDIETAEVMVVFTEPHAYISPAHYEKTLNVPTWNYIAVHAYGKGRVLTSVDATFEVLEATIQNYEAAYKQQWDGLTEAYKLKLSKGIVAFEIEVTDLQAKQKLSQNKTETEQQNIINTLSKGDTNEQHIAEYMSKNLETT